MKIGFDISQTGSSKAGCGYYADGLCHALLDRKDSHEFVLYPVFGGDFWDPHWKEKTLRPTSSRGCVWQFSASHHEAREFWNKARPEQIGEVDLIHSNNFYMPHAGLKIPVVYTVYDLSFLCVPEFSTEMNRQICFRGLFQASLRAAGFVVISESTRRDFLNTFPHVDPDRCLLAYPGKRRMSQGSLPSFRSPFDRLRKEPFWLAVGTVEPRKNYMRLLEAYAHLRRQGLTCRPLAIAGGKGWKMEGFESQIHSLGLDDCVLLLGYVSEEELGWLYENAFAMVYVSLFEGFGMPVIEAMSKACAVIVSNVTSLPEIVGSDALVVEPSSVEEIARAMLCLEQEEGARQKYQRLALRRSERFDWNDSARRVAQFYEEIIERHSSEK